MRTEGSHESNHESNVSANHHRAQYFFNASGRGRCGNRFSESIFSALSRFWWSSAVSRASGRWNALLGNHQTRPDTHERPQKALRKLLILSGLFDPQGGLAAGRSPSAATRGSLVPVESCVTPTELFGISHPFWRGCIDVRCGGGSRTRRYGAFHRRTRVANGGRDLIAAR